jgi:hypothetical protein
MDKLASRSPLTCIMNITIEMHEYDLSSVAKKKVVTTATRMSSTEAFPMAGLALQLEVPMTAASIPDMKVREEYWNSDLDARLEVVVASIHLEAVMASIPPRVGAT